MEFKVIDRTSIYIPKSHRGSTTVTVGKRQLYFSCTSAVKFGMLPDANGDKYIKLLEGLNEDGSLKVNSVYFIITTKESGFRCIIKKEKENPGVHVFDSSLFREFMRYSKCKVGDKFYLQETDMEFQTRKVIEILVNKSINEINKHL